MQLAEGGVSLRIIDKAKKYFFYKRNINVGKNTRILTKMKNFGSEPFLVEIGDNCIITPGVCFITHDASIDIALRYKNINRKVGSDKYELMDRIHIFDNCILGLNSIIMPGVSIGPNSIVGAGAVVTKDVPEGVIVAGNPAKIIGSIDDYYMKNEDRIFLIPITTNLEQRKNSILLNLKK